MPGSILESDISRQRRISAEVMQDSALHANGQRSITKAFGFARRVYEFNRRWPVLPAALLVVLIAAAILAPFIAPYDPIAQDLRARNAPPAWDRKWYEEHPRVVKTYLLGADHVGRDILSRILHGARISMVVAGVSLGSGLAVGFSLGLIASYYGGWIDELIMRIVDVWLAVPFLLIALVVAVVVGQSFGTVMGLLALLAWTAFVRNVRAEVLSLKTRDYVAFARLSGASDIRIIVRHLIPGVTSIVVVVATLRVGQLILAEASLSFLGAGIPSPTPAWGLMVSEGRQYLDVAWWTSVFPGMAIFLTVMSLNFLGDWLRDHFDPRLRQI